jgi:hypothetical protein
VAFLCHGRGHTHTSPQHAPAHNVLPAVILGRRATESAPTKDNGALLRGSRFVAASFCGENTEDTSQLPFSSPAGWSASIRTTLVPFRLLYTCIYNTSQARNTLQASRHIRTVKPRQGTGGQLFLRRERQVLSPARWIFIGRTIILIT